MLAILPHQARPHNDICSDLLKRVQAGFIPRKPVQIDSGLCYNIPALKGNL